MKKSILITLFLAVSTGAFSQNKTRSNKATAKLPSHVTNLCVPYSGNKHKGLDNFNSSSNSNSVSSNTGSRSVSPFPEVRLGSTYYSLQSNGSSYRRIALGKDSTISAIWTMATDASGADRGTGYNYFNGEAWDKAPTARIENVRTGFPSIAITAADTEVVVSHESGALHVAKRAKGSGDWINSTLLFSDAWPRLAVGGSDGNSLHVIARNNPATDGELFQGLDGAITYYRSTNGGVSWDINQYVIPGIDSTDFIGFGGDDYSLDAKGENIAIVLGGYSNDVVLLKSADNGTTWNKTVVKAFPIKRFNSSTMITDVDLDGAIDTVLSNDGNVHVVLDKNDSAHVFYGALRVMDDDSAGGISFFPGTDGLMYWNESMSTDSARIIAGMSDIDGDEIININFWGMYYTGLTSMPSAGIDSNNNIYLAYSSLVENSDDGTAEHRNFRHTYLIKSQDGGQTWSDPTNIVVDENMEGVFASVAKNVTDRVHVVYQKDFYPGTSYGLNNSGNPADPSNVGSDNDIFYVSVNVDSIGIKTDPNIGIRSFKSGIEGLTLSPNPSSEITRLTFNSTLNGELKIAVVNLMGQEMVTLPKTIVTPGQQSIALNTGKLASGVYFVNVNFGGQSQCLKLIVK